ncbi:hypothetical protein NLG97_g9946 [Lecanicillium saksenae]|uniref:Uncharacterized protein n=1 Tax=Lecanicillium saksenae TaxID=468837 RepID=A0ACC1QEK7_9HYPO|nr:hypothetical protein NLG97_g9946 [Lecanicillium saksenae]
MIGISLGSLHCPLDLQEKCYSGDLDQVDMYSYRAYPNEPRPNHYTATGRPISPPLGFEPVRRPDQFVSITALEYMGFTYEKACEIWDALPGRDRAYRLWGMSSSVESARMARQLQVSMLEVALDQIKQKRFIERGLCASGDKDAIVEYMSLWGIQRKTLDDLMERKCDEFRGSRLCASWITDIIEARWAELDRIWGASLREDVLLLKAVADKFPHDEGYQKSWRDLCEYALELRDEGHKYIFVEVPACLGYF